MRTNRLLANIDREIERINAEIDLIKRGVKDHMGEPRTLLEFETRLRALNVRLNELNRNRRSMVKCSTLKTVGQRSR